MKKYLAIVTTGIAALLIVRVVQAENQKRWLDFQLADLNEQYRSLKKQYKELKENARKLNWMEESLSVLLTERAMEKNNED